MKRPQHRHFIHQGIYYCSYCLKALKKDEVYGGNHDREFLGFEILDCTCLGAKKDISYQQVRERIRQEARRKASELKQYGHEPELDRIQADIESFKDGLEMAGIKMMRQRLDKKEAEIRAKQEKRNE